MSTRSSFAILIWTPQDLLVLSPKPDHHISPCGKRLTLKKKTLFFFFKWASLVAQMVKNLPAMQETQVQFLSQEDTLEKGWLPTPVLFPGEFLRQRSLVGYSLWDRKELDTIATNINTNYSLFTKLC